MKAFLMSMVVLAAVTIGAAVLLGQLEMSASDTYKVDGVRL